MSATQEFVIAHAQNDTTRLRFDEIVIAWMQRNYADRRNAPKILARMASYGPKKVSPHTARSWLKGRTVPTWESIEIMSARCPDLCAELQEKRGKLRELLR